MMDGLGKFELPVLAAVLRLRDNAYGVSVVEEVSTREEREVPYGAVHTTLSRLEEKGFLSSKMGEPTAERGGRRKRFYSVTAKGQIALQEALSSTRARAEFLRGLVVQGA
jgi:DNA-binding PadR family transcriptional regulator